MSAMVSLQGVGKTFHSEGADTVALVGIDLEIEDGEFVSLLGPSGCGKSTLLRLVGDLLAPTTGVVKVNGKEPHQARLDRDYGMVFQQATLLDWRRVLPNIELPLEIMGLPAPEREKRAREMLKLVELSEFADRFPWQLSGGMQQRVAIARALALQPQILLMDEPFGALDEITRERMQMELMRIWRQTRTTVIFVTHSIPEAVFLSNRVVVMSPRPGRIAGVVEVELAQPRVFDTREEPAYFAKLNEVREILRAAGGA
ncbi:MAG TPA: ABC transporter ATP-binding protein [Acidimicrobiia bacterium]|nr:ABC transporter ATP-binding protein [Acidimicrobiia bacterium]